MATCFMIVPLAVGRQAFERRTRTTAKAHLPEREHSDGFQYGHGCVTFLTRARVCLGSSFSSAVRTVRSRHKKAPDDAGAFELLGFSRVQYFATTGPPQ